MCRRLMRAQSREKVKNEERKAAVDYKVGLLIAAVARRSRYLRRD